MIVTIKIKTLILYFDSIEIMKKRKIADHDSDTSSLLTSSLESLGSGLENETLWSFWFRAHLSDSNSC